MAIPNPQIIEVLRRECEPFILSVFQIHSTMAMRMRLNYANNYTQMDIADDQFVRATNQTAMLSDVLRDLVDQLLPVVAKPFEYPDIRMWAWHHVPNCRTVIFDERVKIPGYIFPIWNKAHPGLSANPHGGVVPITRKEKPMATRKVVVARGTAVRDPSKVRTPKCPVHPDLKMKFDAIRSVWACTDPTCKIIAQPKNEPEQGRVTLGKGNVQLRLVCGPNGSHSVVLISDDNIALDITQLVNIDEIKASFDMDRVVKAAGQSGLENISIPVANEFIVKAKASISNSSQYEPL